MHDRGTRRVAGRGFQGSYSGAAFHIVLRGNCWVLPDDGDAVTLGTGDVGNR
ncbi:cupin domain-containing protein [Nocardia wallacei]|uniref:cupin domain-containing protein n=1 Tax=Nocardia wallacei TaxID=480035 RepID=UPI002457968B|nr:cupin domain-containing protein [Nocardia wallacei]